MATQHERNLEQVDEIFDNLSRRVERYELIERILDGLTAELSKFSDEKIVRIVREWKGKRKI